MLRVSDVIKVDYERKRIRKEIYNRIYEQFTRKVKLSTEMGYKHTMLTVPSVVFGFPPFDREIAAQYLARQFKNGGFEVSIIDLYTIYVSWNINMKKPKKREVSEEEPEEDIDLPNFMNLKKAAAKYKKSA